MFKMGNSRQITQHAIKIGIMKERKITPYRIALVESKFSELEAAKLKNDLEVVETELSKWGLMVVGLLYGTSGKAKNAEDPQSGHSLRGVPSAFCSLPGIGWIGDFPMSELDVYMLDSCSLKCGKVVYAITMRGGHSKKVLIWFHKKVLAFVRETGVVQIVAKNSIDLSSRNLYELMPRIESLIDAMNLSERFDARRVYKMDFCYHIMDTSVSNRLESLEQLNQENGEI